MATVLFKQLMETWTRIQGMSSWVFFLLSPPRPAVPVSEHKEGGLLVRPFRLECEVEWLACEMSSSHGDSTVLATYGDMDQNIRDVIIGTLLIESSTLSRMLITTEVVLLALGINVDDQVSLVMINYDFPRQPENYCWTKIKTFSIINKKYKIALKKLTMKKKYHNKFTFKPLATPVDRPFEEAEADPQQVKIKTTTTTTTNNSNNNNNGRETEIIETADLEGQDHGPSSSSVGDNDDDFIVYSKEGNNARWFKKEGDEVSPEDILCEVETDNATVAMECTEEVFLGKIIHGDGAIVIKVGEITNLHNRVILKKLKCHLDPSPPTPPRKEDTEPVSSAEPKKPKVANAPQSGSRIFASPLARKLANDHNVPLSKIKGTGSDGTIVQADIEDYLASSGKGVSAPPTSKPKDKATEAGINYTDGGTFTVSNLGGTYGMKQFCAIINPPQSGILAVGSVEKRVVPGAGPDQYTFASYMLVTLSCDHRVIDGA
ncbi:hypothetical protein Sjap_024104 [Stephania japonica]|uniref:Dihydrolipoamide acetyltransferase component of pyruvate dehydrogenase complex n=1 Tax=Stephania japonica TaxID=461633 RepID=A0AAP0HNE2_9MAGN